MSIHNRAQGARTSLTVQPWSDDLLASGSQGGGGYVRFLGWVRIPILTLSTPLQNLKNENISQKTGPGNIQNRRR